MDVYVNLKGNRRESCGNENMSLDCINEDTLVVVLFYNTARRIIGANWVKAYDFSVFFLQWCINLYLSRNTNFN